jgi:hypothetical protein
MKTMTTPSIYPKFYFSAKNLYCMNNIKYSKTQNQRRKQGKGERRRELALVQCF